MESVIKRMEHVLRVVRMVTKNLSVGNALRTNTEMNVKTIVQILAKITNVLNNLGIAMNVVKILTE
jgi:hypothetical protein